MTAQTSHTLRHFSLELDKHSIAWLRLDMVHSPVNRLSAQVMDELDHVLDDLSAKPPAGLVIYSGKDSGFIAGADIDEFAALDTPDKSLALVARGWKLFERLAKVSYPTLALIDGHCIGGGLELALACRYRLVVKHDGTRLSLPEVRLGIFPGWGGMKRLPRLIGPALALDLMLTGRSIDATRAVKIGLADALVPGRLALKAAGDHVVSGAAPRRATGLKKWLNHPRLKPLVARQVNKSISQKDPHHHYPATRAILDMWLRHDGRALDSPDQIASLTQSATTRNLLRVFYLQERLKQFGRQAGRSGIHHVHVVGAGAMGGDIAAWCALKGLRVTLQDLDRKHIAAAQGRAATLFKRRLRTQRKTQAALDRLIPDPDGHGAAHADLVIECIVEDLQAKQALYRDIEPRLKDGAVLATNTSSLSLNDLSAGLQRPERFIGIHFFNPVAAMPLVEVIQLPDQDSAVQQTALGFVQELGKLPLPVQNNPGFLINAVLAPYMVEAMRCVDEGISPATVDLAMEQFGMPMGPIELADTVGLDIVRDAGNQLGLDHTLPACLHTRLEQEHYGRKTGQGFYEWQQGKAIKGAAATPPEGLDNRLLQPLVDKATECVRTGVVADDDLADAGLIFGTGFAPFTGGPLTWQRRREYAAM